MTIKAIETVYKGYKFRSRLEARWAAFFDLIGWSWEYEPVDFKGWIPDFALYGSDIIYVEVKPVIELPISVCAKIDSSGCETEVLLLGQTNPIHDSDWGNMVCFAGWLRESYSDQGWYWDLAPYGRWLDGLGDIGFCTAHGSFRDRITGGYDGGSWGDLHFDPDEIKPLWAEAHNKTQWHPNES